MEWTEERRARMAALIRARKPWERSTGPRTVKGKRKASRNARARRTIGRIIAVIRAAMKPNSELGATR